MTYELSLEYGSYPVKERDGYLDSRKTAPEFLKQDRKLLTKIDEMNDLFHQLFLTIECTFHYVGSQYPEKIEQLRQLYQEVAQTLTENYPDENIHIEYFIL